VTDLFVPDVPPWILEWVLEASLRTGFAGTMKALTLSSIVFGICLKASPFARIGDVEVVHVPTLSVSERQHLAAELLASETKEAPQTSLAPSQTTAPLEQPAEGSRSGRSCIAAAPSRR
jgi:hypothetical protein